MFADHEFSRSAPMNIADQRHDAACLIVEAPTSQFVLMLRTYGLVMPWRRNLQNEVFRRLSQAGIGVVSIRGDHPLAVCEENESDPDLRAACPALQVPTGEWKSVVATLIARAAFIICEVWKDTPGISDELIMIRNSERVDDSLIVLPRPGQETMSQYETFEQFWRLVLYRDLDGCDIFAHPCAKWIGRGLLDEVLADLPSTKGSFSGAGAERDGMPVITPELIRLAERYVQEDASWKGGALHAQNVWNITVRLAANRGWVAVDECEALVRAGIILAHCLAQFNRVNDAIAKLDVALTFAEEIEPLQHYIPELQQIRRRYVSVLEGDSSALK